MAPGISLGVILGGSKKPGVAGLEGDGASPATGMPPPWGRKTSAAPSMQCRAPLLKAGVPGNALPSSKMSLAPAMPGAMPPAATNHSFFHEGEFSFKKCAFPQVLSCSRRLPNRLFFAHALSLRGVLFSYLDARRISRSAVRRQGGRGARWKQGQLLRQARACSIHHRGEHRSPSRGLSLVRHTTPRLVGLIGIVNHLFQPCRTRDLLATVTHHALYGGEEKKFSMIAR